MTAIASTERPRRSGFWNLLGRENSQWWGTRRWLVQALIGLVALDGFLGFTLFILPRFAEATGEELDTFTAGVQIFFNLLALLLGIDLVILTQNTVVGEKASGISAWVLSKPVSRSHYILTKFVANGLGALITLLLIPGAVGYVLISVAQGGLFPATTFLIALALIFLHTLFYIALSLTLGVFADNNNIVLAGALGLLLAGTLLLPYSGPLGIVTPWPLGQLAGIVALGESVPPPLWIPVGMTAAWTIVALLVARWRFRRADL